MDDTTIAFDLGGTKIDICRMDKRGKILERHRVPTIDLWPGTPPFLERSFALFAHHVSDGDTKIGLSWNAPVFEGHLTQSSLLGGRINIDLATMLRERFPGRDIQVESDVHAMALGEFRFGTASSFSPFVVINLGSGAGFAYHDGEDVMRGHLGGAGLVCNETRWIRELDEAVTMDYLLSGRGIALLYERLSSKRLTAAEVAGLAETDAVARQVFDIIEYHFGNYLITLSRMLNPKGFVLSGSVARAAHLFLPRAKAYATSQLEPACQPDTIVVSQLEAPACQGLA